MGSSMLMQAQHACSRSCLSWQQQCPGGQRKGVQDPCLQQARFSGINSSAEVPIWHPFLTFDTRSHFSRLANPLPPLRDSLPAPPPFSCPAP